MNLSFRRAEVPIEYPPQIVLASQSIGRKTLLEKLGVRFRVVVTRVNEDAIVDRDPYKVIKRRASAKANEVVNNPNVYSITDTGKTLVIAADSMALLGAKTFGKAHDHDDAREMVRFLMGRTHTFATALCIVLLDKRIEVKRWEKEARTRVTLKKMTSPEIEQYVTRYDFTRFAACYALSEAPWDNIAKIDGSYTNVIGLPFEHILPVLRTLKILL